MLIKALCIKKIALNLIQMDSKKNSLLVSLFHIFLESRDEKNYNKSKLGMLQKKIIYEIMTSLHLKPTSNQRDEIKNAKLGYTNEKLLVENL